MLQHEFEVIRTISTPARPHPPQKYMILCFLTVPYTKKLNIFLLQITEFRIRSYQRKCIGQKGNAKSGMSDSRVMVAIDYESSQAKVYVTERKGNQMIYISASLRT